MTTAHVWTDEKLSAVQALCDAGMSYADAAKRVGITKSTIDYAVRKGKLPRRQQSPGRLWYGPRLEELRQMMAEHPNWTYTQYGKHFNCSKNTIVGAAWRNGLKQQPEPSTAVVIEFPYSGCMWPEGHPSEPGFHFCGARPASGKPYCEMHAAIAYVRPKDSTENTTAVTS
jgi:GcrA cell cycle regulator